MLSTTEKFELENWTYKKYLEINDNNRYEVIEGKIYMMSPAPDSNHQAVSREIEFSLLAYAKKTNTGKVFDAPIDVIFDEKNVFQPDIVFITNENLSIVKKRGIFGAPDIVVEILSPSSYTIDTVIKKSIYEKFGVKEFWIVDIANQVIELFLLENGKYELFSYANEKGKINSKILGDDFTLSLEEVFVDLIP